MATAMPGGWQPGSNSSRWQQRHLFLLPLGNGAGVPAPFRCHQLRGTWVLWGQRSSAKPPHTPQAPLMPVPGW